MKSNTSLVYLALETLEEIEQSAVMDSKVESVSTLSDAEAALESICELLADTKRPYTRQSARFLQVTLEHLCGVSGIKRKSLGLENYPIAASDVIQPMTNANAVREDVVCYLEQIRSNKVQAIKDLLLDMATQFNVFEKDITGYMGRSAGLRSVLENIRFTGDTPKHTSIKSPIRISQQPADVVRQINISVSELLSRLVLVDEAIESVFTGVSVDEINYRLEKLTFGNESFHPDVEQEVELKVRPKATIREALETLERCDVLVSIKRLSDNLQRILTNLDTIIQSEAKLDFTVLNRVLGCLTGVNFIVKPYCEIKSNVHSLKHTLEVLELEASAYALEPVAQNVNPVTGIANESYSEEDNHFNMLPDGDVKRIDLSTISVAIKLINDTYLNPEWLDARSLVEGEMIDTISIPNLDCIYPDLLALLKTHMLEDSTQIEATYNDMYNVAAADLPNPEALPPLEDMRVLAERLPRFDTVNYPLPAVKLVEIKYAATQLPALNKDDVVRIANETKDLLEAIEFYPQRALGKCWNDNLLDNGISKFTLDETNGVKGFYHTQICESFEGADLMVAKRYLAIADRYVKEGVNYFLNNREKFIGYNFTVTRALLAWLEGCVK